MDKQKASYFLQDVAAYREGTIDEAAMIENLKYFINESPDQLQISDEKFQELLATYENLEAMIADYEAKAKALVEGTDPVAAVTEEV